MQAGGGRSDTRTTPVDLTCKCLWMWGCARMCVCVYVCEWLSQIECVCVMLARAFFCAMLFAVDAVAAAGAVDVVAVC